MIYLDNAATTRPCPEAVAAVERCLREEYFNPSAAYRPAMEVERRMETCRDLLREKLGARGYGVVFTSGGTEANALALLGSVAVSARKQRVLLSMVEHPAVYEAGRRLERLGHTVEWIPVDGLGQIDLSVLSILLDTPADLVSVMQVSNETGAVLQVQAVSDLIRQKQPKARLHVDGVQGFLREPIDLSRAGIDFYVLSAHKIGGPKGAGALLLRKGIAVEPLLPGGGQEGGLRSGTENVPGILGLDAALRAYPGEASLEAMRALKCHLWQLLRQGVGDAVYNGPDPEGPESAPHILNVSFPGIRGEVLLHALEASEIYVSTGSACSAKNRKGNRVLSAMSLDADRLEGAIRFSLCPENTREEMERVAACCIAAHAKYSKLRRR